MSVLKNKRKLSQFEVFHHLYKVHKDITDLLLMDFGHSFENADKRLMKQFGGRKYDELTEAERERYEQASTGEHGYTLQPVKEGGISQCTKSLWLTVLC